MIVELVRGAIIAVCFFFLGVLWTMGRWRRSLLRSQNKGHLSGHLVGVAADSVEKGEMLRVDLTPYFPPLRSDERLERVSRDGRGYTIRRIDPNVDDGGGCFFCRGYGKERAEYLNHTDEACHLRREVDK